MPHSYTPRRAPRRFMEGAPDYVLDVLDHGEESGADRFTVFFGPRVCGDTFADSSFLYLGMSEAGRAVSMFGEMNALDMRRYRETQRRRRIRWQDLSPESRAHVVARWQEGESV